MCAGLAWCHVIWWLLWQVAQLWSHDAAISGPHVRPRSHLNIENRDAETRTCQCLVPTQSDTPMLLICCTTVGNFRLLRRNIMSPPSAPLLHCSICRHNHLNHFHSKSEQPGPALTCASRDRGGGLCHIISLQASSETLNWILSPSLKSQKSSFFPKISNSVLNWWGDSLTEYWMPWLTYPWRPPPNILPLQ